MLHGVTARHGQLMHCNVPVMRTMHTRETSIKVCTPPATSNEYTEASPESPSLFSTRQTCSVVLAQLTVRTERTPDGGTACVPTGCRQESAMDHTKSKLHIALPSA